MTIQKSPIYLISSLFFAIAFLATGYGMILTYVGVYLKEIDVPNTTIGIINASFFLGAIFSSIYAQQIISTVGHIRSFAAFASVMIMSFLLHTLIFDVWVWSALRFLSGFAFYALLIILESWLNEKADDSSRGKVLAIYTIIFYLSTAIGQLFLNLEDFKELIFNIGSIFILVSIFIIALIKIKEPVLEPFEKASLPKIYSVVPLALTSSFIGGFFVGGFFTMMPVYILGKFDSVEVVSFFMLATLVGGLFSQFPIGLFSDRFGRRKLIAFTSFFTAFISLCFIFFSFNAIMVYTLGFLLGLTVFSTYPLAVARANDVVDENKNIIEISRTLLFAYGIGSFFSPIVIGFTLSYYSESIFILFASLGVFLTFYSLSRRRIADDDMSVYVSIPMASTGELPNLDPRSDEEGFLKEDL